MRFDDRLATVLHQPADDAHDRAVRWRQLVDLVARSGGHEHSPLVASALELIRSDASNVPEELRAAAARAVAGPFLPLELLRYFVGEQLSVAAPVLAAVELSNDQWKVLIEAATPEGRRFIATLRPGVEAEALEPAIAEPLHRRAESAPSISEVVARIERLRHEREQVATMEAAPMHQARRSPAPAWAGGSEAMFRWECDPSGEIAWVEGAPRGALVGRSIARREPEDGVDEQVERAFAMRAPFNEAGLQLAGEGETAGDWKISGIPAFTGGRFAGYRGVAVRESMRDVAVAPGRLVPTDPDSLRELVHELKTPLNAIIGFAEMIGGQYLGPASDAYRERAQEIVDQARLLLTAIEDLDFTARQASLASPAPGSVDLGTLIDGAIEKLRDKAAMRGVAIDASHSTGDVTAAIAPELAERLVMRMCDAVIGQSRPGERIRLSVYPAGARVNVSVGRPAALEGVTDKELFRAPSSPSAPGYWLRLTRNLARMVGADLVASPRDILLTFPRS